MPLPKKGEKQKNYLNRCIPMLMKEEGYPQKQAVAICYSYWKDKTNESITEDLGGDQSAGQTGIKHYKTHTRLENKAEGITRKDGVYFSKGKPIGIYLKDSAMFIITEEYLAANPRVEAKLKTHMENLSAGIAMYAAPAKVLLRQYYPGEYQGNLKDHIRKLS